MVPLSNNVVAIRNLTEVKAREILKEITQDSSLIKFRKHARERMNERGVTSVQIIRVLERGRFVEQPCRSPNGNWKMTLRGISAGKEIEVACALDYQPETGNFAIIITTYIV